VPSLARHEALFGRAPRLAVADGGFASRANEQAAHDRGVRMVVLPRQRRHGRSRAVRAALRWRTGCEGRISALKRRHGLRRCRYRGLPGMERWVGLGVIANNLLVLGRAGPRPGDPDRRRTRCDAKIDDERLVGRDRDRNRPALQIDASPITFAPGSS
jgi:Transposase DDE domain